MTWSRLPLLLALGPFLAEGGPAERASRRPRYAKVGRHGTETVWQRPAIPPKGIVFIAHGCMHQGTDIVAEVGPDGWVLEECATSNLGRCLGLPEEVRMREAARERGYVAMAVSGGKGSQSCWDHRRDLPRVAEAIAHVRKEEGLPEDAPVLATGASSGGRFMAYLALPLQEGGLPHLRCIVPQIMGTGGLPNRGVPTLYVHMPRDRRTAAAVEIDMEELRADGTRVEELRVEPLPVTTALLCRCLDEAPAADALAALHDSGVLDVRGFLQRDARMRLWVEPVRGAIAGRSSDTLVADESCLAEVLNLAWGQHEFTSVYAEKMLDFCEASGAYAPKAAPASEL